MGDAKDIFMRRLNVKISIILTILTLILVSFVGAVASAFGISASVKPPDLSQTVYCRNEAKIKTIASINFLDEKNKIDRIVISKKKSELYLVSQGRLYKTYKVAFGFGILFGNKINEGDGRTPEGLYYIEGKNPQSAYNKALKVSYPDARDKAVAKKYGVSPGGNIMIHGFPSEQGKEMQYLAVSQVHPRVDWTQGCIAVTDKEIEEIYSLIKVNTPLEICPR